MAKSGDNNGNGKKKDEAPRDPQGFRTDGPTVEEYVKAGKDPHNYPPADFASKSSDDDVRKAVEAWDKDQAEKAEAARAADPDNAKLKQATKATSSVAPPAATKEQAESAAQDAANARDAVKTAEDAAKKADAAVAEAKAAAAKARMELDAATRRAQDKANAAKVTGELTLKPGEAYVVCYVPKDYTLTLDDCSRVHIKAGLRKLPQHVLDHWYSKAHGVEKRED